MLRKTTGFMIAFAIVFLSAISGFSAQADNSVPPRFTSSVQPLQNAVPSTTQTSDTVTVSAKAYYALKDKLYRNEVLLVIVSILLVVTLIGFIVQSVFLLSRPGVRRRG